jgi:hypothetical protein
VTAELVAHSIAYGSVHCKAAHTVQRTYDVYVMPVISLLGSICAACWAVKIGALQQLAWLGAAVCCCLLKGGAARGWGAPERLMMLFIAESALPGRALELASVFLVWLSLQAVHCICWLSIIIADAVEGVSRAVMKMQSAAGLTASSVSCRPAALHAAAAALRHASESMAPATQHHLAYAQLLSRPAR